MVLFYTEGFSVREADMTTMTARGLDEVLVKKLKERAKEEGTSINAVLLKILREGLKLDKKPRMVVYHDLDHLAGTWSDKDYSEFQKKVADFEKLDKDLW